MNQINHEIKFVDGKKPVFALMLETVVQGKKPTTVRTIYTVDPTRMADFPGVLRECTINFKAQHGIL